MNKDAITQLPEQDVGATAGVHEPRRAPEPVRLKDGGVLTLRDIESAIDMGRE